jgi:hypothetical protein
LLTLLGPRHRYCDGLTRRSFLKVGSVGLAGLSLPSLFRAEAQGAMRRNQKSVIMVYLSGGLAHQDTFDLKPNAPAEIRGEFKPIDSSVPGIQVGEHLPRLARCMDKMVLLRSIVGLKDEHSSWQNMTGYGMNIAKRDGKPHAGAVIAKVLGQADPVIPGFVDLFPTMQHKPYNSPPAGSLGRPSNPVRVDGQDLQVMKPVVPMAQMGERRDLLKQLESARRDMDSAGLDVYYQRAFDVLTSSKLVEALDVTKEPEKVRERYGRGSPKHQGDGAPQWNDQLLMSRRLIEAGARCVTVAYGFWDTHGQNFKSLQRQLPLFDQGISALVEDIYDRGLDRDVTVLVWGEFGRMPKINKDVGRDHWAPVNSALLAGGGMKVGQVIGSTDKDAAYAKDHPIHYHDVIATVYRNLGINPHMMVQDVAGRPTMIMPESAEPIRRVY